MIEFNDKPLTDEEACPDLEVLTVNQMVQMAEAVKERICTVQSDGKKYTDDKLEDINNKLDTITHIPDLTAQLETLQNIVNALDVDGDGNYTDILTKITELQTQITENTTNISNNTQNISNIENKITNIENNNIIMGDNITNLIGETTQNSNDMVELKKDIIDMENNLNKNNACEIYRKVGQATQTGVNKFLEILASECDPAQSPDGAII